MYSSLLSIAKTLTPEKHASLYDGTQKLYGYRYVIITLSWAWWMMEAIQTESLGKTEKSLPWTTEAAGHWSCDCSHTANKTVRCRRFWQMSTLILVECIQQSNVHYHNGNKQDFWEISALARSSGNFPFFFGLHFQMIILCDKLCIESSIDTSVL